MVLLSDTIVSACYLIEKIPPKITVPIVFIGIFVLSILIFHFFAEILYKLIKVSPIKFIDSGLGCLFGIIKAFFLNGILAVLLSFSSPGSFFHNQYSYSHTAGTFQTFLYETIPFMKSVITPIYRRYAPIPEEQENNKKDYEKNIPENVI